MLRIEGGPTTFLKIWSKGAVTGTVVDQQGAVIPNANVIVTDCGTALKLESPKPAQLCKKYSLTRFQKML
jgi:hypothetical protein